MKFIELPPKGAFLIKLEPYIDERGMFSRLFCKNEFSENIQVIDIKQINHSVTKRKGTVRGMHFQYPPNQEIKVVKCLKGKVFDVIVDVRNNSETFLQWHGEILSADNLSMMYIPRGFAHGFQTLENDCELLYLHSEFYTSGSEGGIHCKDSKVNIDWPEEIVDLSHRDLNHKFIDNTFKGIILK